MNGTSSSLIHGEKVVRALRPYGTSIFTEMPALARRYGAVNLSQGFPDEDGPREIRARAAEAILRGPNQYAPSVGIPMLREAVSRKMRRFYDLEVDPELEVTVTAGATEGLCSSLLGLVEPGDEVVLIEPCYDSYAPIASLAGARIRYVSLMLPDFRLPKEELERAVNPRTRVVLINNPQNPCGRVFDREDLEFLATLCKEHDAYLIGDEVYEHLVYDGRRHVTLLQIPGLRDRALVVSSTAKTFSMTGWKIGYVVASPELSRAVRMSHQFITFCGQPALQEAMAYALDLPDAYYKGLLESYTERRDMLSNGLQELGFQVLPTEGTYFVQVDIRPLGYQDDMEFCRMLPREAGVAAIPSSVFWEGRREGRYLVRFCFCKQKETLEEGLRRLKAWLG